MNVVKISAHDNRLTFNQALVKCSNDFLSSFYFTVFFFDKVSHSTGCRRSSEYPPQVGYEINDR